MPNPRDWYQIGYRIFAVTMVTLMIVVGAGIAYVVVEHIAASNALHPVATQLGTEPNWPAVVDKVTNNLQALRGSTRGEVHAYIDSLDVEATYTSYRYRSHNEETVLLRFGHPPFGWGFMAPLAQRWGLAYDADDRLIEAHFIDPYNSD